MPVETRGQRDDGKRTAYDEFKTTRVPRHELCARAAYLRITRNLHSHFSCSRRSTVVVVDTRFEFLRGYRSM